MVSPSMTNSVPVIAAALSDAMKATYSGQVASFCRVVASLISFSAIRLIILVAASVSIKPGAQR
jgi:hypothetical protein